MSRLLDRRASLLLLAVATLLLPWTLWLGLTLPAHHVISHWDLLWAGFDVLLALSLAATAIADRRGSPHLQSVAAASAALLVADAWFDVLTATPGRDLAFSLLLAGLVELPLAGFCLWIALGEARRARTGPRPSQRGLL